MQHQHVPAPLKGCHTICGVPCRTARRTAGWTGQSFFPSSEEAALNTNIRGCHHDKHHTCYYNKKLNADCHRRFTRVIGYSMLLFIGQNK